MEEQIKQLKEQLTTLSMDVARIQSNLGGLTNDIRQQQAIRDAVNGINLIIGDLSVDGILEHKGDKVGFYDTTPISQQVNITKPTGGTTIDTVARVAIVSIIDLLESYGLTA